ncbi:MAG: hypothetical protein KTR16_11330 [Acidiferrobacterales bacterium]|nr:hypothetical protein [Acidiferrobacterales bacterium]
MKNSDMPAMPIMYAFDINGIAYGDDVGDTGLTKREQACIQLGVPETGDAELDAIIMKAERKRIAANIMAGLASNRVVKGEIEDVAKGAVTWADALIKELSK